MVAPVPPEPTASAEARVRTPAFEKDDVAVPPKYAVPVLEKREDEAFAKDCRAVQLFALPRLREMVPLVVIVPPDNPLPATIDVTVPLPPPPPTHVPLTEKHPVATLIPLANVDVADVPVIFKYVDWIPAAKVEVAVVEVAVM